jgi:deoxyguanosine kinase
MANIKIISIEGNIGSGKTTLLRNLRDKYSNNREYNGHHIMFLKEPVDEWEKMVDSDGNTMLQKFYANQEKYSFAFQMMAYISRLKILRDAIKHIEEQGYSKAIIFTERCLYTDKYVFAKMLYDQGKIEDVCYQFIIIGLMNLPRIFLLIV